MVAVGPVPAAAPAAIVGTFPLTMNCGAVIRWPVGSEMPVLSIFTVEEFCGVTPTRKYQAPPVGTSKYMLLSDVPPAMNPKRVVSALLLLNVMLVYPLAPGANWKRLEFPPENVPDIVKFVNEPVFGVVDPMVPGVAHGTSAVWITS
jgi:hypothetical protein